MKKKYPARSCKRMSLPLVCACSISLGMITNPIPATAQGLFQKAVGKFAKVTGSLVGSTVGMTGTSTDLESLNPQIVFRTNLYSKEVGALEVDLFGKGWKGGNDGVQIQFTKKHGIKMTKLQGGSVSVDGKPAAYQDLGVYTYVAEHSDGARKIEITASNGQKSSFTISPDKAIKLTKINGQTGDNISVDITRDVVLEFENPGPADGALIQVSISASTIGLNTFYEVGSFKPAAKVTVPAAAFMHAAFPGKNGKNMSFNKAFLQVARTSWEYATEVTGEYKSIPYMMGVLDGRFIKIGAKPEFSNGLVAEGEVKGKDISYEFEKPAAAMSRPFAHAKTIGIASFGIRGTSSAQKTETNRLAGTKTETSVTFTPSNELLDGLLAKMYPEVVAVTESVLGGKTVPIEKIAATAAWQKSGLMSETNDGTETTFARAYKTTKILSEAALKVDGYRIVADEASIGKEAEVSALLRCVLDLVLEIDNGKTTLTPVLHYSMYGASNGVAYLPTTYVQGTVQGKSSKVGKKNTSDADIIEMINAPELINGLRTALTDLKAKEKADGAYDLIWSLQ